MLNEVLPRIEKAFELPFIIHRTAFTMGTGESMIAEKIKDFETVLNSYYPTVSDIRLSTFKRGIMRNLSAIRYKTGLYWKPYELKVLQLLWKYRQPEIEGF